MTVGNIVVNAAEMVVSFDTEVGHFDENTGESLKGTDPRGLSWKYGFTANLTGTTYSYPANWTLTIVQNTAKPDYVPNGITATKVNLAAPTTFTYKVLNQGAAANRQSKVHIVEASSGTIVVDKTIDPLGQNGTYTDTFQYTFTAPGSKTFMMTVDYNNDITEMNETNNTQSYTFDVTANITGDFDILPSSTIMFRDTFQLQPVNFDIPLGCTYIGHWYKFDKDGVSWYTSELTNQSAISTFTYPNEYPDNLSVGGNDISLKIDSSCGTTGWIATKTLFVEGPENRPPIFSIGWFHQGDTTGTEPIYQVPIGQKVNLRVIQRANVTPAEPYDPDGDPIYWNWQFAASDSSWVRRFPTDYGLDKTSDSFKNIPTDTLGSHQIELIGRDRFGASSTSSAWLDVIPPNPVPLCTVPSEVKENRPVPAGAINADKSYSPMETYDGSTIDHSQDIWWNKQNSYYNGTLSDVTATVTLSSVADTHGRYSLSGASCSITVHPDLPPVAALQVPSLDIRGQQVKIYNKSYSPDGDTVVSVKYKYKYDSNNNGFADDWLQDIPGGDLNSVTFTPSAVGKYLFYVQATEDWGKQGDTAANDPTPLTMNVVNNAPSVSVNITGNNPQPDLNPLRIYSASSIIANWSLYDVNSTTPIQNNYQWSVDNGSVLRAGLGKGMERQITYTKYGYGGYSRSPIYSVWTPFPDAGYGPNGISPWKGASSITNKTPILIPTAYGSTPTGPINSTDNLTPVSNPTFLRSNTKYLYFDANGYIWAWNKSKIPEYQADMYSDMSNPYAPTQTLRHHWINGVNPYDFVIKESDVPSGFPSTKTVPYYSQADEQSHPNYYTEASNGDFSHASGTWQAPITVSNGMWEVSGRTIYRVATVSTPSYGRWGTVEDCDDDGCETIGYTTYPGGAKSEVVIFTYDAYTGNLMGTSYGKGAISVASSGIHLSNKGENLLAYQFGGNGFAYTEFDRHGNIVADGSVGLWGSSGVYQYKYKNALNQLITDDPRTYWCGWDNADGAAAFNKDDQGNIYFYDHMTCSTTYQHYNGSYTDTITNKLDPYLNPEAPSGLYVLKINVKDFTLQSLGRLGGVQSSHGNLGPWDTPIDADSIMYIDPFNRQILTRSYHVYYCGGYSSCLDSWNQSVNMDGGGVWDNGIAISQGTGATGFHMDTSGVTPFPTPWCTVNASGTCDNWNYHSGQKMQYSGGIYGHNNYYASSYSFGQYFGDGFWVAGYGGAYEWVAPGSGDNNGDSNHYLFVDTGPPITATTYQQAIPHQYNCHNEDDGDGGYYTVCDTYYTYIDVPYNRYKGFHLGQFVSTDTADDAELQFSMAMEGPTDDTNLAGFSFRMQDPQNRYAVESDGSNIFLSKYVGGNRVVLASQPYAFDNSTYTFKVSAAGDKLDIWMNGIPVFHDIHDSSFASGKFGPFTDKSFVDFSGISMKVVQNNSEWLTGYAILDDGQASATVQYNNLTFSDPENDPMTDSFHWHITHVPKFLNNGGYSVYNNRDYTSTQTSFDKVGVYTLDLKAEDDPNPYYRWPSMVFDNYRRWSNAFSSKLIVHRRPIAQFTLTQNPDGTISWNDTSYDPDRFDPAKAAWDPARCSVPDTTGYNYCSNRGVISELYGYIDPDYNYVQEKLTEPAKAGHYTVLLQVVDEYGAKSYPAQVEIDVGAAPQTAKPTVQLTNPSGSQASPTISYTTSPQIAWNQQDSAGFNLTGYEVQVLDENGQFVIGSGQASQNAAPYSSGAWAVPSGNLSPGSKYQVQVRVWDKVKTSDWSNIGWLSINSKPAANITNPNGLNRDTPTLIFDNKQPTISWVQTDRERNYFNLFDLEVDDQNGNSVYSSGVQGQWTSSTSNSFKVPMNLPTNVPLQAKIRVTDDDSNMWSDWSPPVWFLIDMSPAAGVAYPSGSFASPTFVTTTRPTIQYTLGDPDSGALYSKVQILIKDQNGNTFLQHDISLNNGNATGSWTMDTDIAANRKYQVFVNVFDSFGASSGWQGGTWMVLNRPPTADVSWSPNPVFEGDTVAFTHTIDDPDSDTLSVQYNITGPAGFSKTASYTLNKPYANTGPSFRVTTIGDYTVTLTVSDGKAPSVVITKTMKVYPLSVKGYVKHTDDWEKNRRQYNTQTSGNPDNPRGPSVFWAGERFVLQAETTVTGTATKAIKVDVNAPGIGTITLTEDSSSPGTWNGHLGSDNTAVDLEKLADGSYSFTFTTTYNNGIVKTDTAPIQVLNVWTDFFALHRRY